MTRSLTISLILAASIGLAAVSAQAQTPGSQNPSPLPNSGGGPAPAGSRVKDECDQGINICKLGLPLNTEAGKRACSAAGGQVMGSGPQAVCRKFKNGQVSLIR